MNDIFKLSALFSLLLIIPGIIIEGKTAPLSFDKADFYATMANGTIDEINSALGHLEKTAFPEKTAYQGALLMKKAGLSARAKEKLSLFKSGRAKLEAAIKNDDGNVEYHFLRLIIQEKAPKIVKYQGDLKKDTEIVTASFKELPPIVQQAVRDYSKKSTVLKPADL